MVSVASHHYLKCFGHANHRIPISGNYYMQYESSAQIGCFKYTPKHDTIFIFAKSVFESYGEEWHQFKGRQMAAVSRVHAGCIAIL